MSKRKAICVNTWPPRPKIELQDQLNNISFVGVIRSSKVENKSSKIVSRSSFNSWGQQEAFRGLSHGQ